MEPFPDLAVPILPEGCVHVWQAAAPASAGGEERLCSLLDAEERSRLNRFRFAEDRAMFATGRAAVRRLLGSYAGAAPAAVRLVLSSRGQPLPAPDSPAAGLNFSVSHSGGRVVLAFSRGFAVGVDIEFIRPKVEIEAIVRRYFSPLEAEPFLSLPAARRTEAFFAVWTRKEAFVKARGEGLTCPLDAFAVTVEPAGPPRLVRAPAGAAAGEWSLCDLDAGPGFRAALAVRHPSPRISSFQMIVAEPFLD